MTAPIGKAPAKQWMVEGPFQLARLWLQRLGPEASLGHLKFWSTKNNFEAVDGKGSALISNVPAAAAGLGHLRCQQTAIKSKVAHCQGSASTGKAVAVVASLAA